MRVLHFSDIHLPLRWRKVPARDWLGKRLIGGMNLLRGRGAVFDDGPEKVAALDGFRRELGVDLVLCTGDYTSLGTEWELRNARERVQPLMQGPLGYVHVPGNHDFYARDVILKDRWAEAFGDVIETDLPEYRVDGTSWPFVRLIGDDVAVVGVNSARPNPLPWRSSGRIPKRQLDALERVLADAALANRFVFVMTHYAPLLEGGRPDKLWHRLVNAGEFLEVCSGLARGVILCGHIHRRYLVPARGARPPIACAGSATKEGRESLWVFDVERDRVRAIPGRWNGESYEVAPEEVVEI